VPLSLCPLCLSSFVPSLLAFHAAENDWNCFFGRADAFLLSLEVKVALHLLEEIQARPADSFAQNHLTPWLQQSLKKVAQWFKILFVIHDFRANDTVN